MTTPTNQDTASVMTLEDTAERLKLKLEAAQKRADHHKRSVAADERWEAAGKEFNPVYDRSVNVRRLQDAQTEAAFYSSALHHLEAGKFDGLLLDFLERNTTPDERHDVMHLPGLPWAGSVRQAIHAEICAEWPLPLSHPEQEGQQG